MNDPSFWICFEGFKETVVDIAKAAIILFVLYMLFACGGHGQDQQGTGVVDQPKEQTR